MERGSLPLAAQCFSKASHFDPTNLTLIWQKANLYQELGMVKKASDSYESLLMVREWRREWL